MLNPIPSVRVTRFPASVDSPRAVNPNSLSPFVHLMHCTVSPVSLKPFRRNKFAIVPWTTSEKLPEMDQQLCFLSNTSRFPTLFLLLLAETRCRSYSIWRQNRVDFSIFNTNITGSYGRFQNLIENCTCIVISLTLLSLYLNN